MEFPEKALKEASRTGQKKEREIWKVEGIEERIHTERGTLEHLFRNVLQSLQLDLAPRYTHGEDSPFEVIVPWAMATKI